MSIKTNSDISTFPDITIRTNNFKPQLFCVLRKAVIK